MKQIEREECREVQMSVLDEIARICKEHHLDYSLSYGTLLGAVRHKGYIPWDDDIDISLMREDYDKLIAILKDPNVPKKEWFSVVDDTDDGYFYSFAKAYDNRTVVKMDRHKGEFGIWVDIFPLDNLPKSSFWSKFLILFCAFLRVIELSLSTDFSSKTLSKGTLLYKRFFYVISSIIGKKRFCRFVEKVVRVCAKNKSEKVVNLFYDSKCDKVMDREKLMGRAEFAFENRKYLGYANYDYYLSTLYRDYMTPPPEGKRWTHEFDCWWK